MSLQAQLVILSSSDEKHWDGSGLRWLKSGCVAQQAWDGGVYVSLEPSDFELNQELVFWLSMPRG